MEISKAEHVTKQLKLKNLSGDTDGDDSFSLLSKIINGALGSGIGVFALFPLDTVKTRMQSPKSSIYKNWFQAFGMITRQEGIKGLYNGVGVTLALVTPELTAKLVTYDYMHYRLQSSNNDLTLIQKTFAAAVAGFVQIHITTPSELIKVQLQTNSIQYKTENKHHTLQARDVFKNLFQGQGILGLYRGYVVTILRDVLFAMIYFPIYSFTVENWPLNKREPDQPVAWAAFSGGCIAGLVASFVVTPFDVIKTRMQADIHASNSILHNFRKIIAYNGSKGLFRGATCRGLLIAPLLGICQMVYSFDLAEKLKDVLNQSDGGTEL